MHADLTRFIGRDRELEELRRLLGHARLLTITGAGGSGKTRLAHQLVLTRGEADPALETGWVDLARITDADVLGEHVAASLGVRRQGPESAIDAILSALHGRRFLLVLDNCEHLVAAAAAVAEALLRGCPGLQVLATSREALGVSGETAWLLPTMTVPDAGAHDAATLMESEAVLLFLDRAANASPAFRLDDDNAAAVARICRRLDGLPLALELAAARVAVLTPAQIASRLDDRFRLLASPARTTVPRHRTLHEVIDWSYQSLNGLERTTLQRLGVFAGDFSLDAAEAVCGGDGVDPGAVLDLVAALAGKSLMVVETAGDEARYRLLETVRHFAFERLRETGDVDRVRQRHAGFYVQGAVAREAAAFGGGSDPSRLAWFDAELEEMRAAADWLGVTAAGADDALRLATTLEWFWFVRGRFPEGRRWLEAALRRADDAAPRSRGRALAALALLAFSQNDTAAHRRAAEAAVDTLGGADDPASLAHALSLLGCALALQGEHARATRVLERGIALARTGGSDGAPAIELVTVLAIAGSSFIVFDEERVRPLWEESVELSRAFGVLHSQPHLEDGLGRLAYRRGDLDASRRHFLRALELQVEDPWCRALVLQGSACLSIMDSDYRRAGELLGCAAALRARIAVPPRPDELQFLERLRHDCTVALGDEAFAAAFNRGGTLEPRAALDHARQRFLSSDRAGKPPSPRTERPTAAVPDLEVRALGPLEIRLHGELATGEEWSHARPRELLLYLLCHPEGRTRDQAGLVFWPDASAAQVRNRYHVLMHRLRRTLGDGSLIIVDGDRYRVDPARHVRFDVADFVAAVTDALRAVTARRPDAAALEAALSAWRGPFLDGESVGDWHLEWHDRLQRLYVEGLEALGKLQLDAGDGAAAAATLERLMGTDPLNGSALRTLMLALTQSGRRERALRHYARFCALLDTELGAVPDPETQALAERLRDGVSAQAAVPPP